MAAIGLTFNFPAFKTTFGTKDVDSWIAFYAPDAEWWECRHDSPPRAPHRMAGGDQIRAFLDGVAASGIDVALADEVIGPERIAFSATATLPGGRRIYEHVILHLAGDTIVRQIDVEAWDWVRDRRNRPLRRLGISAERKALPRHSPILRDSAILAMFNSFSDRILWSTTDGERNENADDPRQHSAPIDR